MGIRDSTRYATTTQPFDKRALSSCSTKATSPLQCQQTSFRDQRSSSKLAIELLVSALLSISYHIFKSNELLVPATSMRACRQEELHNTCASKMAPCSLSNLCCIADPQPFLATLSRLVSTKKRTSSITRLHVQNQSQKLPLVVQLTREWGLLYHFKSLLRSGRCAVALS